MHGQPNALKLVKDTLDKYSVTKITPGEIKSIIAAQGYTVIGYTRYLYEEPNRLISALGLEEHSKVLDSFTYKDRDRRFVFVRKNVSHSEYLYQLCLELGRILTYEDVDDCGILGTSTVWENAAAHEFAYHMTDMAEHGFFYNFFMKYTVNGIVSTAVLAFSLIAVSIFAAVNGLSAKQNGTLGADSVSMYETADVSNVVQTAKSADTNQASSSSKTYGTQTSQNTQSVKTETKKSESSQTAVKTTSTSSKEYYATKSGKKYHVAGCSYLSGRDVKSVSSADIASGKYTPCSRCIG